MTKSEIQKKAINILTDFIAKTEEGEFKISNGKVMRMRFLLDTIRENYFGAFRKEKDPIGQRKVFYPLTETLVWENVKNIDVDTKDVNVRANNPSTYGLATITRNIVRDWMEKETFGVQINDDLMYFALDGHLVTKKVFGMCNTTKKPRLKTVKVDLRNIFRDMTGGSLQEEDFIERSVEDASLIKERYKGKWINLDKLKGDYNVPDVYDNEEEKNVSPEVEIYTAYMRIPKSLLTGKSSDDDNYINGRIIASGLKVGKPLIHRIEEWNKLRPYEEAKFEEAPGRWIGRGIGEKMLFLQLYLNTIYNVRRNNNLTLMNQLFQFREGSGITPDKISKLFAGGAIGVQQIGDIARIDTRNINFNESIGEEQNILNTANRIASSQEASTGEALPASTSATSAIIQSRAVKTSFQLRQERFGLYLSILFKRQLLPDFYKLYKKEDILRLLGEEEAGKIRRRLTRYYTNKFITDGGRQITPQQRDAIEAEVEKQIAEKQDLFIMIDELKDVDKLDISFFVTDEMFDKATILQNLQQILVSYRQFADDPNASVILRNILDILGLDSETILGSMDQHQVIGQQGGQLEEPEQLEVNQEGMPTQDGILQSQNKRVSTQEQLV